MMNQRFQEKVRSRLIGRPHLFPLFTNPLCIPERLNEYNADLFVVFNANTQRYEVHSLDHMGDTLAMVVRFFDLDIRTLRDVWKNDIRVHGKDIFRRIEESERKMERDKKKKQSDYIQDFANEFRPAFAKGAWNDDEEIGKLNYFGKKEKPKTYVQVGS